MSASSFFAYLLAIVVIAFAISVSFSYADDLAKAGMWLVAAFAFGLANCIHFGMFEPKRFGHPF